MKRLLAIKADLELIRVRKGNIKLLCLIMIILMGNLKIIKENWTAIYIKVWCSRFCSFQPAVSSIFIFRPQTQPLLEPLTCNVPGSIVDTLTFVSIFRHAPNQFSRPGYSGITCEFRHSHSCTRSACAKQCSLQQ